MSVRRLGDRRAGLPRIGRAGSVAYLESAIADGALAFWWLNEASGTTIADALPNGRNGTYSGATLAQTALFAASSASALGGASGQGIGSVASASWMNLSTFTVECWVKPANTSAFRGFFSRYQFAPGGWLLFQDSTQFGFDVVISGADKIVRSFLYTVGLVYYLAGTYDGTTQKLYVNGGLVASQAAAGGGGTITQDIEMGGYSGTNYSQANEAACAVYPSALTDKQIANRYALGLAA